MRRLLLVLGFLIQCFCAYSQNIITGVVTDAEDNKLIPYVSIGVTNVPDGTISNTVGSFSITLGDNIKNTDTLKFSSIGYQLRAFLIGELRAGLKAGPLVISLNKAVTQLQQVAIVSKKANVKIEGYDTNSKLFGLGFGSSGVGSQGGIVIPIKHPGTGLENISFYIIQNPFEHLVFRVNIYELVNGMPGDNILSQNILINIDGNKTGKMVFDLSKYNIYVDKDVLVALEWLEAAPASNANLAIGAKLFGHSYYQEASQYAWVKRGNGIGLSVKTSSSL